MNIRCIVAKAAIVLIPFFVAGVSGGDELKPREKEWTLLVFLNGDNNLDSYGEKDMREMEMVGSSDEVNILVLRDTISTSTNTKIYYMEKGSRRVVKDMGSNIDMGDWRNLVEFFRYAKENYPAKKYLVDIWNHGSGWRKEGVDPISRGISYDDHSGHHISTPQLGEAFGAMAEINGGRQIDILGMDACLMQMAEVAYEVADSVKLVIASEQTEPANGWAYQAFLGPLVEKPVMGAEELGALVQSTYVSSYNGGDQGNSAAQGSVIGTAKLVAAMETFQNFVRHMISQVPVSKNSLQQAINAAQSFYVSSFKDVIDFVQKAKENVADEGFRRAADDVISAFEEAVVANFVAGASLKDSKGFSTWIPGKSEYESKKTDYASLKWARDSGWMEFIEAMIYPNTPIVSVKSVGVDDENGDSFNTAGEKITFNVGVFNESPVAARNARLHLVPPAGIDPFVGSVDVESIGQGDTFIQGLSVFLPESVQPGSYGFLFRLEMPGFGMIEKTYDVQVDKQYQVEPSGISTPHEYPPNYENVWTVEKAGVDGIRVHFAKFDTEAKYDFVFIYDKNNKLIEKYDGAREAFWSSVVPGDSVKIKFTTDNSVQRYGFDIDKIAY